MTTLIENINEIKLELDNIDLDDDKNLPEYIFDFSLSQDIRLKALEKYYILFPNDSIEIVVRLSGLYQFNGIGVLKNFLYEICVNSTVSSMLKIEAAKALLLFEEDLEDSDSEDDEEAVVLKQENNSVIVDRNEQRSIMGFKALNTVCVGCSDAPTPCRVQAVCLLMQSDIYMNESNKYFKDIINDMEIDCDYRYKTILALENKDILSPEFFLREACGEFLQNSKNMTMYRILAGQYLLQNYEENDSYIEETLLSFAQDGELDYNLRADAADTLLSLGSENVKNQAQDVIICLGRVMGDVKTVFENAQNVHTDTVEESVYETLEFLTHLPLLKVGEDFITFEHVSAKIRETLKKCKPDRTEDTPCSHCGTGSLETKTWCSEYCERQYEQHEKITVALNRICMDRVLYSKLNNTLVNILLKIWTYMDEHKSRDEMMSRLLQELEEMSGTCSSGFATRLVNVISGFGQFNIRISWEDQIVANFTGRLNARARKITDSDSVFRGNRLLDVVELWLNSHTEIKVDFTEKSEVEKRVSDFPNAEGWLNVVGGTTGHGLIQNSTQMSKIVENFLQTDRENKVEICVNDFAEAVINEMAIPSSQFELRQNFLLFLRTNISSIREELYLEFIDHMNNEDFDLWFRKAISTYEGC